MTQQIDLHLTFLEISPNIRYLSTFFNGLCTPLFGMLPKLSMNGPNSFSCVSGMVQTAGPSLSNGLGITSLDEEDVQLPLTRLDTAWGVVFEPRVEGSSVAHEGRAERARDEGAAWADEEAAKRERRTRRLVEESIVYTLLWRLFKQDMMGTVVVCNCIAELPAASFGFLRSFGFGSFAPTPKTKILACRIEKAQGR